jgi:hypothetical protein
MLNAVDQLLRALSPMEVQAAVERHYVGRLVQDPGEVYWHVYGERHRVLADVFATQRSNFLGMTAAFLQGGAGGERKP